MKTKGPEVRGLSQYGKTTIILSPPSVRFVANRTGSQLLLVLVALLVLRLDYLPSDFTRREIRGVDVCISGVRQQCSCKCRKGVTGKILFRERDHVGGRDRATNGTT